MIFTKEFNLRCWRRSGIFIVNFKQISRFVILNQWMSAQQNAISSGVDKNTRCFAPFLQFKKREKDPWSSVTLKLEVETYIGSFGSKNWFWEVVGLLFNTPWSGWRYKMKTQEPCKSCTKKCYVRSNFNILINLCISENTWTIVW